MKRKPLLRVTEDELRKLAPLVDLVYDQSWKPHIKGCHAFPLLKTLGCIHGWKLNLEYDGEQWKCSGASMRTPSSRVEVTDARAEAAIFRAVFSALLPDETLEVDIMSTSDDEGEDDARSR